MILAIIRDQFPSARTLSRLLLDDKAFGFVCEDMDRGLDAAMPIEEIIRRKVPGKTAIPIGRYRIAWKMSPKRKQFVPWLIGVPAFQNIQIHPGNTENDTGGCILPGLIRDIYVGKSRLACLWLYPRIEAACASEAGCWIDVRRDPQAWAARLVAVPELGWVEA